MAYEVSSSVANSSFTVTKITETHNSKDYRGGIFSPDGTKLFVPTGRCEATFAGDTDKGVDIWSSSSVDGWSLTDSFETNQPSSTNRRVSEIHPLSNSTALLLVGAGSNTGFVQYASSGSSGWTTTNIGELHSDYTFQYSGRGRMILNPSKTIGIIFDQGDEEISTVVSGSSGWSLSTSDIVPASVWGADWNGAVWADDRRVFVFNDNGAGGAGQIDIYELTSGETGLQNSHWTKIDGIYGNSSAAKGLGAGMYYHTSSNTFLAIAGDGSTDPLNGPHSDPTGVDLFSWQSSSADGYLPNAYTDLTKEVEDTVGWNATGYVIDTRPGTHGGDTFFVFGNPDSAAHDGADFADIVVFESGSSGWKGTVVSGSGALIGYNTSTISHQGVDTNNGFRLAYAEPNYLGIAQNPGQINILDFHVSSGGGDATAPTITSVTSDTSDGTKKVGDNINITVNFSEAVTLAGGNLVITLETGATDRTVTISSISNATSATGVYTVQAGDTSNDLTVSGIALSAGTLKDAADNAMSDFSIGTNLAASSALVIDGVAPTITNVAITSATNGQNNFLNEGDVVSVTVTYDEAVTVVTTGGTPSINLDIGGQTRAASYASGTGTTSIVFTYEIAANETYDDSGIEIDADITLNGGTMKDAAGNNADLTFTAVAANSSYKVDTTTPSISSLEMANDNSTVTVTFGENVYSDSSLNDLAAADFALGLSGGNAGSISLNATPSSVSKTSASEYVLTLNGTNLGTNAAGTETLTVGAVSGQILDAAGNAASTSTSSTTLNDTVPINDAVTSTVGTGGGTIKAGQNNTVPYAELTVPENALTSNVSIKVDSAPASMSKAEAKTQLGTFGVGQDTTVISEIVSLEPHGTSFEEDITLKVRLTGDSSGTCPSGLKVWKRAGPNANEPWYPLPSSKYTCSNGVITIVTNTFSQYMATEGSDMGRTRLNDTQLEKIVSSNKVDGASLVLSGSAKSAKGSIVDADIFLVQAATGAPVPVSASVMQDYFSKVDITETAATDASYQLLFVDDDTAGGGDGVLRVDGSHLTYNPSSNLLTVGGAVTAGGNVTAVGSFIIGSADLNETDLEKLDGITNGTVAANKAVVADADRDIQNLRHVTASSLTVEDITVDANSIVIGGTTFNASDAAMIDGLTAGTVAASKAMVVDSNRDIGTVRNLTLDGTISGATTISGSSTISGHAVDIETTADLGGKLTVVGVSDLDGGINVSDTLTVSAAGALAGATTISGSGQLAVGTIAMAEFTVARNGDTDIDGTLNVQGVPTFQAGAVFSGGITTAGAIAGASTISGSSTISGHAVDIETTADLGGKLTVVGVSDLDGGINVNDTLTVSTAGALAGATTISGSGVISGLSLDIEKGADFNSGGLTNAGAISGVTQLTASHARITNLDVVTVNSIAQTETTLEIEDKLIVSALSASAANADGGGLRIGGGDGDAGHASVLWSNTDSALDLNIGSSTIAAVTTAGINVAGTITGDTSLTLDGTTITTSEIGVLDGVTAGTVAAGKAVVVDSDLDIGDFRSLTASANIHAASFHGDGSNLTGVGAEVSNAENLNADLKLTFVSGTATAASFFIDNDSALLFNPSTDTLKAQNVSGSGTFSMSHIDLDGTLNAGGKVTVVGVSDLDGGIDVNGSNFTVSTAGAVVAASLNNSSGGITNAGAIAGATTISGSSTVSGHAVDIETTADVGGKLTVVGVSDLDGGIDVNGSKFTVSTAGAVVADSTISGSNGSFDAITGVSLALQSGGITAAGAIAGATTISGSSTVSGHAVDIETTADVGGKLTVVGVSDLDGGIDVNGSNFTVSTAGAVVAASLNNSAGGITNAGSIAGATTIAGSGLASLGSLAVDDGSTIGTDSDTDMLTLTNGDKIEVASDVSLVVAAGKFEIGDGNAVTSNHTELNYLDGFADAGYDQTEDSVVFFDATDSKLKHEAANDFATTISGGGLSAASGKINITPVQQIFFSASQAAGGNAGTAGLLSPDMLTASLATTHAILGNATTSGSLQVFLNGMLQTMSGSTSTDMAVGRTAVYDYRVDDTVAVTKIYLESAMDDDDVLVVRYLKA